MTRLEERRVLLEERLRVVETSYAIEHREEHAASQLSERVRQAALVLKSQCQMVEKSRESETQGSPELYWMARGLSLESQSIYRRLEISELEERLRLLAMVQERFRRLLPESVMRNLSELETSPGEVVVELAETEARNRTAALELLRLEGERVRMENALEASKIAYSNASAMAELSAFENKVLEVAPTLPARKRSVKEGFGLGYLEEVVESRADVEVKLRGMEAELRKMRQITVDAVNALDDPLGKISDSRHLVEECELLAAKYVRGKASARGARRG